LDNAYNQRGMAFDPLSTNLVLVDTHTGQGASDHGVGHIYILSALTGANLDDGSGGDFILNTNGIPTIGLNQAYPYAPAAVADDGVVYVCNQVNNSTTTPFMIYRWESSTSSLPPVIAFSNNITPAQRYGTSIDIRGAGPNTQIIIGSLASGSTGTKWSSPRSDAPLEPTPFSWMRTRFTSSPRMIGRLDAPGAKLEPVIPGLL